LDDIGRGRLDDQTHLVGLAFLLQGAVVTGHRDAARVLVARLQCIAHLSIGDWFYTTLARHLGDAAVLLGEPAQAQAYYAQALGAAGRIRFRPELALTRLSLAQLLIDHNNNVEAVDHLDVALPELTDMRMQPALERARALRDRLASVGVQARGRQAMSDGLTAREREITGLLALGLSNREIAENLVIAEATVEVHVKRILNKLGFKSRSQVAAWVARQG
jgi:DNA-binding CsgD family transcriptional regulator